MICPRETADSIDTVPTRVTLHWWEINSLDEMIDRHDWCGIVIRYCMRPSELLYTCSDANSFNNELAIHHFLSYSINKFVGPVLMIHS